HAGLLVAQCPREHVGRIIPRPAGRRRSRYASGMAPWGQRRTSEHAVVIALVGALAVYAVLALLGHRVVSGIVAPLVALLLAFRHRRARFSAYVFFSALAYRAVVAGAWPLALFAGAAILLLQTPPARRAWP